MLDLVKLLIIISILPGCRSSDGAEESQANDVIMTMTIDQSTNYSVNRMFYITGIEQFGDGGKDFSNARLFWDKCNRFSMSFAETHVNCKDNDQGGIFSVSYPIFQDEFINYISENFDQDKAQNLLNALTKRSKDDMPSVFNFLEESNFTNDLRTKDQFGGTQTMRQSFTLEQQKLVDLLPRIFSLAGMSEYEASISTDK